ncbi:hypothetical protein [Paenibacillus amylolyticus]|uniref:hypothetical protein n=1 Tax=Paenibacillus amylolyticus TaxID=1451 RepID=UPI001960610B|nr:hypothetical protein [Paenibacillus amylolyticus]
MQIQELKSEINIVDNEILQHQMDSTKVDLKPLRQTRNTDSDDSVTPYSTSSDFKYDHLNVYKDSDGFYYFDAQGQWQNRNWSSDAGLLASTGDPIGGEDGYMIGSLHRDLTIYKKELYGISEHLGQYNLTNINPDTQARGVGWIHQDKLVAVKGFKDLNTWRYVGYIKFKFTNGVPARGSKITFKSKVGHTWDSKSLKVNGFTMNSQGVFELGFTTETSSKKWRQEGTTIVEF